MPLSAKYPAARSRKPAQVGPFWSGRSRNRRAGCGRRQPSGRSHNGQRSAVTSPCDAEGTARPDRAAQGEIIMRPVRILAALLFFAGLPAVVANVTPGGTFRVTTAIPRSRAAGSYTITGRCGGGEPRCLGDPGRPDAPPAPTPAPDAPPATSPSVNQPAMAAPAVAEPPTQPASQLVSRWIIPGLVALAAARWPRWACGCCTGGGTRPASAGRDDPAWRTDTAAQPPAREVCRAGGVCGWPCHPCARRSSLEDLSDRRVTNVAANYRPC